MRVRAYVDQDGGERPVVLSTTHHETPLLASEVRELATMLGRVADRLDGGESPPALIAFTMVVQNGDS